MIFFMKIAFLKRVKDQFVCLMYKQACIKLGLVFKNLFNNLFLA